MNFSIRATIRALIVPNSRVSCHSRLWAAGLAELRRRGGGRRESGAFLLGSEHRGHRRIQRFVYYDDLDPGCLDSGIVVFDGAGYGPLWELCREAGLTVVADVHTHLGAPRQSHSDRTNPMVAKAGHFALIVPNLASELVGAEALGVYEYEGSHRWRDHSGPAAKRMFYIGGWG